VVVTLFTKLRDLSSSLHKTIYGDVDFMNNVNIALSNEEMTNIKVVDLKKLYNFVVGRLRPQHVLCNSYLPSVKQKTLGKQALCRQRACLPSGFFLYSAKSLFAECFFSPSDFIFTLVRKITLGKEVATRQTRVVR
jgi:hypothetical protein